MTRTSWDQLSSIFSAALERPEGERARYVEEASAGDAALRDDVLSLLEAHGAEHELEVESRLLLGPAGMEPGAHAPLEPGTLLGPYQVEALAGEGGMGEVYRAERVDGAYRQTVAIKVLRTGLLTAETVRRFRLEREALARLVHPDIAAIHDAGTAPDGRPYLVLQFVDGVPITEYAEAHDLGVPDRLRLFCRVAEAVHFAHSRLVIHRDLKPSNILVEADGAPKLLDFGVAKLLDADALGAATRPDVRILTPEHAAPEQLRGEPVGTATDVYALGVLLFELLSGRRPFPGRGRTPAELERAILHDPAPLPSAAATPAVARQLRGDLDRIVAMALRKEPDRRYASASQLAEDVGRYLAGLPVRAQRDTLRYRAAKFVRRHRGAVAASAAAVALLVGFSATTYVQARRLAAERDRVLAERAAADDLVQMLTRLFDRANPTIVPGGDTVRVVELLREADRQVEALAEHPERQARLRRTLGQMYFARGEYARARDQLRRAWETLRALPAGETSQEAALAYHDLARVVYYADGAAAGRGMLDSSLVRLRALPGLPTAELARAVQDRADASWDVREQRRLLDEVVALRRRVQPGVDSMDVAASLNAEGSEAHARGDARRAAALFDASLRILERRLSPDHPNRLAVAGNLAVSLLGLGEMARADSLERAVIALLPAATPADARATHEERLALIAANQGRLPDAERLERAALDSMRSALGPTHDRVANSMRNLGLILIARGQTAEGLARLDSAIVMLHAQGEAGRKYEAYMRGARAGALLRLGRTAEARAELAAVRPTLESSFPSGHTYLGDLSYWLGALALAEGDHRAAEPELARALERRLALYPPGHPKVLEARCALSVATAAPAAERRAVCSRYAAWGLADPMVVKWGMGE